jgi:hypothetical protein
LKQTNINVYSNQNSNDLTNDTSKFYDLKGGNNSISNQLNNSLSSNPNNNNLISPNSNRL